MILLFVALCANALTIPPLAGHINDYANILDSRSAQIDRRLTALENETTVQAVILTITALPEDYTIEEYSMKVVEAWKIGQKGKDNGVLITVAYNDHKMRIEVGYGLEGVLTDAQAKLIITRKMAPKFRENDYTGGLIDAVNDICGLITGDEALKEAYNPPSVQKNNNETDINVVVGFIITIIILLMLMLINGIGCSIICGLFAGALFKELIGGGDWLLIPIIAALIGLFILRIAVRSALCKTRKGKGLIEFVDELSSAIFSGACSSCLIGGCSSGGGGYSGGRHSGGGGGWSSGGGSHYSGGGGHFGGGGASGGW